MTAYSCNSKIIHHNFQIVVSLYITVWVLQLVYIATKCVILILKEKRSLQRYIYIYVLLTNDIKTVIKRVTY